jgi:MtN3 and saliva related transmembrane protein
MRSLLLCRCDLLRSVRTVRLIADSQSLCAGLAGGANPVGPVVVVLPRRMVRQPREAQGFLSMAMDWATVVGTVGAIASVSSFTPQAWKIIRERRTEGLSLAMFALTTLAFVSWTTFGILKSEWTLIVPNAICLALAAFILVMIALPAGKTRKVAKRLDPRS